jgi:hypothetical protein
MANIKLRIKDGWALGTQYEDFIQPVDLKNVVGKQQTDTTIHYDSDDIYEVEKYLRNFMNLHYPDRPSNPPLDVYTQRRFSAKPYNVNVKEDTSIPVQDDRNTGLTYANGGWQTYSSNIATTYTDTTDKKAPKKGLSRRIPANHGTTTSFATTGYIADVEQAIQQQKNAYDIAIANYPDRNAENVDPYFVAEAKAELSEKEKKRRQEIEIDHEAKEIVKQIKENPKGKVIVIDATEEIIVNFEELADNYATWEFKLKYPSGNVEDHQEEYDEMLLKHKVIIEKFKSNKNG